MIQLTATDADDPTYGNSARVVYSILEGQPYFSVDAKTGTAAHMLQNPLWNTQSVTRATIFKPLHVQSDGFQTPPDTFTILWATYEFLMSMNDVRWPDKVDKLGRHLVLIPHLVFSTVSHYNCSTVWF